MTNINYELIDTTAPAPEQEPERQRYFIAKCREIIKERELEIGRKLTFYDQTFGCQMNFKDSEKLNGILEDIGYVKADTEKADFVYYNTCTVRENANVRVYGRLGALKNYKKKNPEMVIAMCGCMMQEPEEQEKVKTTFKFVDVVFGTHNIFKLAELLYECLSGRKRVFDVWEKTDQIIEDLPSDRKFGFKAGVNIMCSKNNINKLKCCLHLFLLLRFLHHASTHGNDHLRILLFIIFQCSKSSINTYIRILTYSTCIIKY